MKRTWTDVAGRTIHAWVTDGPVPTNAIPLILVAGLGLSARYLLPVARQLSGRYRVFAPDLPAGSL